MSTKVNLAGQTVTECGDLGSGGGGTQSFGANALGSYIVVGLTDAPVNARVLAEVSGQTTVTDGGVGGFITVGLATAGTAGTYAYPASMTTDAYGRTTSVTAGPTPATAAALAAAIATIPTAGTGILSTDDHNSDGTSAHFARVDHVHNGGVLSFAVQSGSAGNASVGGSSSDPQLEVWPLNLTGLSDSDITVGTSSSVYNWTAFSTDHTATLPALSGVIGKTYYVIKDSSTDTGHTLTITPQSGETIDGVAGSISFATGVGESRMIMKTSGGWIVMAAKQAAVAAGADALGTYLVQTATHKPTNAQVLASLATGLMKVTTTTGVVSTAAAGTDYQVPLVSGTDYEVPLTFNTGVTRTSNVVKNDLLTGKSGGQTVTGGTASGDFLKLQSTTNVTKGPIQVGATALATFQENLTVASATSATLNQINLPANTVTITGSTAITTAAGFNYASIAAPVYSAASAVAITSGATLAITGAPSVSGSATITNARALWVQAGITRLDGDVVITSTNASGNPLTTTVPGLRIRNTTGNISVMQFSFSGTGDLVGSAIAGTNTGIQVATQGNFVVTTTSGLVEAMRVTANGNTCIGTQTDNAPTRLRVDATKTVASGTSAVWDGVDFTASTLTLSGSTAVTTATGLNMAVFRAPTLTYGSGAVTVTNAATVAISGAPIAGGTGPTVITNSYALWVQGGNNRIDGPTVIGGGALVAAYNLVVRPGASAAANALIYSGNTGNGQDSALVVQSGANQCLTLKAFNSATIGSTSGISNSNLGVLSVVPALSGGNLLITNTKTAFDLIFASGDAEMMRFTGGGNQSLFQATSFGSGVGVTARKNATTAPTVAPSAGTVIDYVEGGHAKIMDSNGIITWLN